MKAFTLVILLLIVSTSAFAGTLYAKAAGGNWSAAGTWSNTGSGGGDSSGPPTAADDVILELGSGNVTIDGSPVCRSLNTTSGTGSYGGTLSHDNSCTLTIGDGTAGAGNVALNLSAGTYSKTNASTSAVSFVSSSTTTQTITTNPQTLGNITINHANIKLQLTDALTCTGTSFTVTAANTFDMNGNQMTFSAANFTFNGGSRTYTSQVNFTGSTTCVIGGTNTFSGGFNRTGTAVTTSSLTLSASQTVSGGNLTLAGNSSGYRLFVQSSTFATAMTITNAGSTPVWSYVDFRDITLGTAYDASGITGGSGNAGGNTNITFSTAQDNYYQTAVSANWSDAAKWFLATNGAGGAGRMPLPQDTGIFDANSVTAAGRTIALDNAYIPSLNTTGVANTPTFQVNPTQFSIYGSLTLVSGLTWSNGGSVINWVGRGSYTVTCAGKVLCTGNQMILNNVGGTLSMQDAFSIGTQQFRIDRGTLTTNDFALTAGNINCNNAGSHTLNLGSSTLSLSSATAPWTARAAETTVNAGTSTISMTNAGASNMTFTGAGKTYNNLKWVTGGAGTVIITGSNTFGSWQHTGGSTKTVTVTAGTTQTFTGGAGALQGGASGNLITYKSVTDTSAWTLSSATKIVTDYISLRDCTGAGAGIPHNAGSNSTSVSGNTNWTLGASGTGNFFSFLE